jgi:hypothetical protein
VEGIAGKKDLTAEGAESAELKKAKNSTARVPESSAPFSGSSRGRARKAQRPFWEKIPAFSASSALICSSFSAEELQEEIFLPLTAEG